MKRFILSTCCAAIFAVGFLASPNSATASGHQPRCDPPRYEWVLNYESRREAYRTRETRCDECGRRYTVEVTQYRTVRVQVWQYVRVR